MKTFRIVLFEVIEGEEGHGEPLEIGEFEAPSVVIPKDAFLAAMRVIDDVANETEMENLLRAAKADPRDLVARVILRLYDDPYRASDPPAWRSAILTSLVELEEIDTYFWVNRKGHS